MTRNLLKKNWKIIIIFFLFFLITSGIIVKLYFLQIKNNGYYQALALGQQVSFNEQIGQRGEILWKQSSAERLPYESLAQTKQTTKTYLAQGEERLRELSTRFYPYKELGAHLIGFVNEDGQGQYGLEGYYDYALRGADLLKGTGRSPFGYLTSFLDLDSQPFLEKGASIWVTIDYNIQYFAEKLLTEAFDKWQIDSGQIIVSEPMTGRILALANYPSFDPNSYFDQTDIGLFLNPVIQKLFEPGSVFKPITMAGALEQGLIEPETTYIDEGFVEVGGPKIYNFEERIWGEQTMTDVLEESINTGAVFVQQKLGNKNFLKYLEKFGLFEKTGIDLQGEVSSRNQGLKNGYPRDFAVASFGQGVMITPIQLIRAFGAIANGGELLKPYLIEKIIDANNKMLEIEPVVQGRAISNKAANTLTSMLVKVVEQGAGRRTKIDGYFIAGKTGTAQVPETWGGYSEDKTIQSFIGYFPAFAPRVLILVKLDNPKGVTMAGRSAVLIFKELAEHIINLWQIPPELPQAAEL